MTYYSVQRLLPTGELYPSSTDQSLSISEPNMSLQRDVVSYNSQSTSTSQTPNAATTNDEADKIHQYFLDNPLRLKELSAILCNLSLEFKKTKWRRRGHVQQLRNYLNFSMLPLFSVLYPAFLYTPRCPSTEAQNMDGMKTGQYLKDFENETYLAEGGYGSVYKAFNKVDKQYYAIKKIPFPLHLQEKQKRIFREVICLARVSHANVVFYKTCWMEIQEGPMPSSVGSTPYSGRTESNQKSLASLTSTPLSDNHGMLYIQMELCDETLEEWLSKRNEEARKMNGFSCKDAKDGLHIFKQIVKGVQYLHSQPQNIIHRDLKPKNVLFKHGKPKIADFGLAVLTEDDERPGKCYPSAVMGTLPYSAPEQWKELKYTNKADMYALGVILLNLIYPFTTDMELYECLKAIKTSTRTQVYDFVQQKVAKLAKALLSDNPGSRPAADKVLKSDIFLSKQQLTRTISQRKRQIKQVKSKARRAKLLDEINLRVKEGEIFRLQHTNVVIRVLLAEYEQEIATLKERICEQDIRIQELSSET